MSDADLVPAEPPPSIPGGYYVCIQADADGRVPVGAGVYVLDSGGAEVRFVYDGRTWSQPAEAFIACFEQDPQGRARQQAAISEALDAVEQIHAEVGQSTSAMEASMPHIADGQLQSAALISTGATDLKRALALRRNEAAKLRNQIDETKIRLEAQLKSQQLVLEAEQQRLSAMVKTLEEGVWSINLYLGQDEQIVRLAEGAVAPPETPLTVRSLVLYMDEECAVAAEEGGISPIEIDLFDAWLVEAGAHLQQILPEPKGVVALKPRRHNRRYENPWQQQAMDEANRKTYFLFRNGDNLYRMWTSFDAGETLTPTATEFVSFFRQRQYNFSTRQDEEIILTPGSAAFMKASEQAEARRRHYMRLGLLLQGVIDRTTILRPLASTVNLADPEVYVDGRVQIVNDADLVLADGRERFKVWLERINGELEVGSRIVGAFGNWDYGLRLYDDERRHSNERITPSGAGWPESGVLHTLEGRRDSGLFFRYMPGDGKRWDRVYGYVDRQRKASCLVKRDDEFILNVDAATVDEMSYFLRCRLDREHYTYLFPVLKAAIRAKRIEAEEEAPFRQLLAAQISRRYAEPLEIAAGAVEDLVSWWKLKNRIHRALTSDDAKALRMIVQEFGIRRREARQLADREDAAATVEAVLAAHPNALLVAHKQGNEYVALVPEDERRVFVAEQTWRSGAFVDTRRWQVVDKRYLRWRVLHQSNDWESWKIGARLADHLTAPEISELALAGWEQIRAYVREYDLVPLAVTVTPDGRPEFFFQDRHAAVHELLLSQPVVEPRIACRTMATWWRKAGRIQVTGWRTVSLPSRENTWPWLTDGRRVLWLDSAAITNYTVERDRAAEAVARAREMQGQVSAVTLIVDKHYAEVKEREAYEAFLREFGDLDLWEGHRKALKRLPKQIPGRGLLNALTLLIERGVDVTGKTVGVILAEAALLTELQLDKVPPEVVDFTPLPVA